MKITLKTKIHPSEDEEKVIEAVENIFPDINLEIREEEIIGKSEDPLALQNFKNKLGIQAIRESARRELKKGKGKNSIRFTLNKQAATVDKVSFSEGETPLGGISVEIESDDLDELIDIIAPSQKKKS